MVLAVVDPPSNVISQLDLMASSRNGPDNLTCHGGDALFRPNAKRCYHKPPLHHNLHHHHNVTFRTPLLSCTQLLIKSLYFYIGNSSFFHAWSESLSQYSVWCRFPGHEAIFELDWRYRRKEKSAFQNPDTLFRLTLECKRSYRKNLSISRQWKLIEVQ